MLRLDHWVKNVFIVAGYFLALLITQSTTQPNFGESILVLGGGLIVFGLASSSNYVINEFFDRSTDAFHPIKKHRHKGSHHVSRSNTLSLWIGLVSISIICSSVLSFSAGILCFIFLMCGVFYNIPPFRFKDKAYVDVYWESLNSPLRIMYGWILVSPDTIPPLSLLFAFHALGAFLMSAKRFSEYQLLNESEQVSDKSAYRKSMGVYTLSKLQFLVSVNSCLSILMFTVFVSKHNQQSFPFLLVLILGIGLYSKKMIDNVEQVTESPHKLYVSSQSLWFLFVLVTLWIAYINFEVSLFDWIFNTSQLQISQIFETLSSFLR
jgi:4-hydroxybenzoate polyprenyltransferase